MILQTQKNIFNIMASANANWFIYYYKRIPLIGKILPDSIYTNIGLKRKVSIIAMILRVFNKLLAKAIFIGLLMILPVMLIGKGLNPSYRYNSYIYIFFMLNFLGSLLSSTIFEPKRDKYICIRLMHMDPKKYNVSAVLFSTIVDILYFLPLLTITTVLMGGSILTGIFLVIWIAIFDLVGEAFHLLIYSKTGAILSKKVWFFITFGILCLVVSYVPVFLSSPLLKFQLVQSPLCILIFTIAGALSVYTILHYDRYHDIAYDTLKAATFTVDANKAMGEARFADVAIREKEFADSDLKSNKFESRKGFAYLNAIFFERHKRLLIKPIIIRIIIIAVLFLAAVITSVVIPGFAKPLSSPEKILPIFVFIMYFTSIGDKVCKAMFYNCDISLLRYSFYRDKNAVLANFKVRLMRIAGLNLIVAAAISASVTGFVFISRLNWSAIDIAAFTISILFLSLFFSVHYLFLYYVFQPYTAELGMKNPFFSSINAVVYIVCYMCLKIKSAPSYFTLIVIASTFIYIVAALFLVYKKSPTTFRVK